MKRGMFRRFTAFFMAMVMLLTLMPTTVFAAGTYSEDNSKITAEQDGITVTKKAEFTGNVDATTGDPEIRITFTVDTNELNLQNQNRVKTDTDIVLVIDNSGSMQLGQYNNSKLQKAKEAAKSFVNSLYGLPGGQVRIGLVYFDENVTVGETMGLKTKDAKVTNSNGESVYEITNKIDSITKGSGTNIQAGIAHAQSLLDSNANTNKIIVVLSDGEPHESYTRTNKSSSVTIETAKKEDSRKILYNYNSGSIHESGWGNWDYSYQITAAIDQAYLARADFDDELNIYSIGYDVANAQSAQDTLRQIADDGKYQAAGVDALTGVFNNIVGSVQDMVSNVTLTDTIPNEMINSTGITDNNVVGGTLVAKTESENGQAVFTLKSFEEDQVYTMSFTTTLDLSQLTASEYYNEDGSSTYFNTNGENVSPGGQGLGSSVFNYKYNGNGKSISLDSPQLPLKSYKYDVEYYYDDDYDNSYVGDIDDDRTYSGYVFGGTPESTIAIKDGLKQKNDQTQNDSSKEGYVFDKVTIGSNDYTRFQDSVQVSNDTTIKVYYKKEIKTTIEVKKVWDDRDDQDGKRPESINYQITTSSINDAGEDVTTVVKEGTLSESNKWTDTVTGLKQGEYTVTETTELIGYSTKVEKSEVDTTTKGIEKYTYTITNTHTPETTNVNVTVAWEDDNDRDGKRPSNVTATLYKIVTVDGEEKEVPVNGVDPITISSTDITQKSFSDLPKYENGEEINYVVKQSNVKDYGYTPTLNDDTKNTFIFTNKYVPERTEITVNKVWKDNNNAKNARPTSISVTLLGNSDEIKTVTIGSSNTYTFTGLYKYENKSEIKYSVVETSVDNYDASIQKNGNTITITNVYGQDDKRNIPVTKIWDDSNNVDGIRPSSVEVNLLANGDVVDTKTLTKSGSWTDEFKDLPVYDTEGVEITYTIEEKTVPNAYESKVNNTNYTITNSHTPYIISKTVKKLWVGDDYVKRFVRPAEITVQLYANGTAVSEDKGGVAILKDANSWQHEFTNLPKNYLTETGETKEIAYTVVEQKVNNYELPVYGVDNGVITVTNKYKPVKTKKIVNKVWADLDNHDGKRPSKVTVNLVGKVGDKIVYEESAELTASNNSWQHIFNNLDKYYVDEQGNADEIEYSITEEKVDDYNSDVKVDENGITTITNSHSIDKKKVTVTKVWDDDNNRDGVRPDSIQVQLYVNGTAVSKEDGGIVTLTESNQWTYTWENLEVYGVIDSSTGKVLPNEYTVDEVSVPNKYSKTSAVTSNEASEKDSEATITNEHKVDKKSLTVEKTWNDNENQDGKRPGSVTVRLFANGEAVPEKDGGVVTLSESNTWTHTWTNLYVNKDGEKIEYTVKEDNVANYTSNIKEDDGLVTITNTHKIEKITLTIEKDWVGDAVVANNRPDKITVDLLADEDVIKTVTLEKENDDTWSTTVNVDRYKSGKQVRYSIANEKFFYGDEEKSITGYTVSYSDSVNGDDEDKTLTVTNTYNVETENFTVKKVWDDNNNQDGYRPASIGVQLFKNGDVCGDIVTLNETNKWTYTWADLEVKRDNTSNVYTVKEVKVPDNYTSNAFESAVSFNNNIATITNTHKTEVTSHSVTKVWEDDNNNDRIRPTSIEVELYANGKATGKTYTLNSDNEWTYTWTGLDKKESGQDIEYSVKEVSVPVGYNVDYNTENKLTTITNTHINEKTTFKVVKEWNDNDDNDRIRPDSVVVQLYADGVAIDGKIYTLTKEDNWTYTWTGLNKLKDGTDIVYTVDEVEVPTGYTRKVTDIEGGQKITNTHDNEETSHTVTKVWDDNSDNDNYRPDEIEVQLYAKGADGKERTEGEVVTLEAPEDANSNWTYTWNNLTKNDQGVEIEYYAKEVTELDEYDTSYSYSEDGKNSTITNTHEKDQITLTIEKEWIGDSAVVDLRPASIVVKLYADGEYEQDVTLTKANGWKATVVVDRYDAKDLVEYTVKEATKTSGYTVSYSDAVKDVDSTLTVTNTYNVETANFTVNKSWIDANNQDGIRPTQISVQLYQNGVGYGLPQVLNESNNWTYTWSGLETKRDNDTYTYTVEEVEVPQGYSSNTEESAIGFTKSTDTNYVATVTNSHIVDTTTFTVEKEWVDNNDNDGYRPTSIEVELYANDVTTNKKVTLSESNGWTFTWNNLDKKAAGKDIVYTVKELDVPSQYNSSVTGLEDDLGQKITNTHAKDQVKLTIKKVWSGDSVVADKRPTSIVVKLYADGVYKQDVTLEASKNWETTVDVDRFNAKSKIEYTIQEATFVSGYTATYSDPVKDVDSTLTVTNTYNVEIANFTVVKSWLDNNNQDGYRPTSIQVQLYKNNVEYTDGGLVTLNESNNWTYTWANLETTRDNHNNVYTVKEIVVKDSNLDKYYVSNTEEAAIGFIEIDGVYSTTITNTHEIEKTEHTVNKVWDDDDDNDRIRPESIEVELYADGVATKKIVTLNDENQWTYTWTDLDKKDSGKDITYTAKEIEPEDEDYDYEASYETEGTVTTITNTHENEVTSFKVVKVWDDANNNDNYRPREIEVQLYTKNSDGIGVAQGDKVKLKATDDEANSWTYTWNNLTKYEDGVEIEYYAEEINVPTNYTESYDTKNGVTTITNKHAKDMIELTIKKAWAGDNDYTSERPKSIEVELYAGDTKIKDITLEAKNNWETTVEVERFDAKELVEYSVKEATKTSGYTVSYSNPVKDVDSTLTVTNTYNVVRENFTVVKEWIDANNQDGIRPESINVELYEKVGDKEPKVYGDVITLSDDNNWTYTWENLETSRDGITTTYAVKEVSVPKDYESNAYESAISFDDNGKAVITNTHETYTKDITVMFKWDDLNDIEGVRTDKMIANLYKVVSGDVNDVLGSEDNSTENDSSSEEDEVIVDVTTGGIIGYILSDEDSSSDDSSSDDTDTELVTELVDSTEVTKDTWFATFKNVPVNENGKEIVYLITQAALPNEGTKEEYTYVSTVNTSDEADFVITNKYRATINKDITIIWDDENNNDNVRPEGVVIQPTVDGEKYGEPIIITVEDVTEEDSNTWTGKTSDLPKYTEDGKEITYRVVQSDVINYETTYSEDSFIITNKYRKPALDVEVQEEEIIVENDDDNKLAPAIKETKKAKDTPKSDITPDTSDPYDISKYIWMMLLSAMGILVVVTAKKKEEK